MEPDFGPSCFLSRLILNPCSQRACLRGSCSQAQRLNATPVPQKGVPRLPNVLCRVPRVYGSERSCFNRVIILLCQALYHDCAFSLSSPQMPSTMTWLCKRCGWFCRGRLSRSQFMILSIIAGEPPLFECVPQQYPDPHVCFTIFLCNQFTLAQVPSVNVVTDTEEKTVCCSRKDEFVTVYPADVVLFEGILMFYSQEIRDLFQMKLFVDTDPDTRLSRRGV